MRRQVDGDVGTEWRISALHDARELFEKGMTEPGISCTAAPLVADAVDDLDVDTISDEDAYVNALIWRMRERGVW